ncbi:uncharacterized protein LOC124449095 [Xenia sp. Carnegie-2017]|uniref:uncharacterized protein LOC124449095 n=1 Tax=Xenia sp. Carnegie-2017 TaxID=2897299 RepID=UPI001F04D2A4|nr:uncharacterized protein LOC124449095 [Xenia sp. Carnegie-2017]
MKNYNLPEIQSVLASIDSQSQDNKPHFTLSAPVINTEEPDEESRDTEKSSIDHREKSRDSHFNKDEQGKIVSEDEKIKERWREYFDRLLNTKNNRKELDHLEPVHGPVPEITEDEVRRQLKKMNNNKARGPDELPIELVKKLGNTGTEWMTSCCREIMKRGIPEEWRTSRIVPLYKQKGDLLSCGNYRGIKLLCHSLKLFERVIEARLREIVKIKDNQCGFQRGKSTTEPMFCLRML